MKMIQGVAKRQSGQILITPSKMRFTSFDQGQYIEFSISFHECQISVIGENNSYLLFKSQADPARSFSTTDTSILDLLPKNRSYDIQKIRLQLQKKKGWSVLKVFLGVSTPLLLLFVIPWMLISLSSHLLYSFISEDFLRPFFKEVAITHFDLYPDHHLSVRKVREAVQMLTEANPELQNLSLNIYVSKDMDVNAFATLGETIIVNKGFLLQAETSEEVIGVLAHELAHIHHKHILESVIKKVGPFIGLLIVDLYLGADLGSSYQLADIIHLKYSRDFEREADQTGFKFLTNAHISYYGLSTFFNRMLETYGESKFFTILSTHPHSRDRIEHLDQLARKLPVTSSFSQLDPQILRQIKLSLQDE